MFKLGCRKATKQKVTISYSKLVARLEENNIGSRTTRKINTEHRLFTCSLELPGFTKFTR